MDPGLSIVYFCIYYLLISHQIDFIRYDYVISFLDDDIGLLYDRTMLVPDGVVAPTFRSLRCRYNSYDDYTMVYNSVGTRRMAC